MHDNPAEVVSTTQAALMLGLSDQTIINKCRSGEFTGAFRTSGHKSPWRIPKYAISEFMRVKARQTKKEAAPTATPGETESERIKRLTDALKIRKKTTTCAR